MLQEMRRKQKALMDMLFRPIKGRDLVLVLLSALVGTLCGLAVRGFEQGQDLLFETVFHRLPQLLGARSWLSAVPYVAVPALGGLLLYWLKARVPREDRGHAVPLVIVSLIRRDGLIRLKTTVLKTLGNLLTLGLGASLGREGPVVLLGGGVGSAFGRLLRLPRDWVETLVAVGAGSAVATAFHAPLAGAFFALEIVLVQFESRSFTMVALGAVTAAATSSFLGGAPLFQLGNQQVTGVWDIFLYVLLGLLIAPLSRLYIWCSHGAERYINRWVRLPAWAKLMLGGAIWGAVGLAWPATLGGGYDIIPHALAGQLALPMLLGLLLIKLALFTLTLALGWTGGVFAPALFLGAMAGGAFGSIARSIVPAVAGPPGSYAAVGMAAMIAGASHAPLTALALLLETTQDYRIALPAMIACGIATIASQRYSMYSIDTMHLSKHGVVLPWQVSDLRNTPVAAVMQTEVDTVRSTMTIEELVTTMQQTRHTGYPVLDETDRLVGIITLADVRNLPLEGRLQTQVAQAMKTNLATVRQGQILADAALVMARRDVGRLPVVADDNPSRLVGILTRSDILRAYRTTDAEDVHVLA